MQCNYYMGGPPDSLTFQFVANFRQFNQQFFTIFWGAIATSTSSMSMALKSSAFCDQNLKQLQSGNKFHPSIYDFFQMPVSLTGPINKSSQQLLGVYYTQLLQLLYYYKNSLVIYQFEKVPKSFFNSLRFRECFQCSDPIPSKVHQQCSIQRLLQYLLIQPLETSAISLSMTKRFLDAAIVVYKPFSSFIY